MINPHQNQGHPHISKQGFINPGSTLWPHMLERIAHPRRSLGAHPQMLSGLLKTRPSFFGCLTLKGHPSKQKKLKKGSNPLCNCVDALCRCRKNEHHWASIALIAPSAWTARRLGGVPRVHVRPDLAQLRHAVRQGAGAVREVAHAAAGFGTPPQTKHTHTHTMKEIYIYIHIYICMCVCVCVFFWDPQIPGHPQDCGCPLGFRLKPSKMAHPQNKADPYVRTSVKVDGTISEQNVSEGNV